jgi:hypothetical protein
VRLLHAGHMVVPSAICVPHPLQKAIESPLHLSLCNLNPDAKRPSHT